MRPSAIRATFLTVETETAVDISELSFYSNEAGSIRARGPGPSWAIRGLGPGARSPGPGARAIPGYPGPGAGRPGRGPGAHRGSGAPQTSTESTKRTESNKSTKRTHTKQEKTKSTKSTKSTPKIAVRPWLALVLDFWKASCAPRRDVTTDSSQGRRHRCCTPSPETVQPLCRRQCL